MNRAVAFTLPAQSPTILGMAAGEVSLVEEVVEWLAVLLSTASCSPRMSADIGSNTPGNGPPDSRRRFSKPSNVAHGEQGVDERGRRIVVSSERTTNQSRQVFSPGHVPMLYTHQTDQQPNE